MDFVSYQTPGYGHLEAVELISVGMDWPANIDYTCTFEHVADIIAATSDPLVQDPRIKLGHESEVNGAMRIVNPFNDLGDAAPAFGKIVNLRTDNGGAVLLGDFVEVPLWLADSMPSAYPSRSAEPWLDVETPGGKRYSAILTAVSLLGEALPAVKDLEDLQRLMDGGPVAVTASTEEARVPELSVSVGTIRDRFNFEWTTSEPVEGADTYWWWARDVRVDPEEIIADDDEGNLWRVPFTTDGEDTVTFEAPEKVREVYVPIAGTSQENLDEAQAIAALSEDQRLRRIAPFRAGQRVLAAELERPAKAVPVTAASAADHEEDSVTETTSEQTSVTPEQLTRLRGLPEDATQDQINEALAAETPPDEDQPEVPEETPEAEVTTEPEPVAASLGETIDKEALAQLQADARAGREARAQQLSAERDQLVQAAVKAGKFPPSASASYRAQLDKGGDIEASTRTFIAELSAGTVPVEEVGITTETETNGVGTGWFPHLDKQEA